MVLPFISIPCASSFSGVRYPVGYNPDLRLRPNYYPNKPLQSLEVKKKWTPPLGYDPKCWKMLNRNKDEDLYTDIDDTDDTDSYETYENIKFKNGKYIVEGVWVGRAIIKAKETISFEGMTLND